MDRLITVLRAVEDSQKMDGFPFDGIDNQVRKRREDELSRARCRSYASLFGELPERLSCVVQL